MQGIWIRLVIVPQVTVQWLDYVGAQRHAKLTAGQSRDGYTGNADSDQNSALMKAFWHDISIILEQYTSRFVAILTSTNGKQRKSRWLETTLQQWKNETHALYLFMYLELVLDCTQLNANQNILPNAVQREHITSLFLPGSACRLTVDYMSNQSILIELYRGQPVLIYSKGHHTCRYAGWRHMPSGIQRSQSASRTPHKLGSCSWRRADSIRSLWCADGRSSTKCSKQTPRRRCFHRSGSSATTSDNSTLVSLHKYTQ